ncbi:GNAT family N-acetyltransferase [Aeromonas caviae]|uniref:GNAT family N-acetyltransferase n=1 Tax=Aeromonas caviae TaxID=648 RepID=UPI003F7442A6
MTDLVLKSYVPADADQWDAFVAASRSNLFMFKRGFMDYHAERFHDASVMIYSKNKLRGVFPANRNGAVVYSHQGLTYGGLLTRVDAKSAEIESIFDALADYYHKMGVTKIQYKKIPWCFSTNPCEEDVYFLYQREACLARRDLSSVIDLGARPKLSDSRKNVIKKAQLQGASFEVIHSVPEFHELLSEVLAKHDAKPIHSVAELELLMARFPSQIQLHGCYLDNELYAAACLFDFGHVVHTQYLAASLESRKIGALDYLIEQLIIQATQRGKRFFSFGISTEAAGKTLNYGLIAQKEGFGGRGVALDFYEWCL